MPKGNVVCFVYFSWFSCFLLSSYSQCVSTLIGDPFQSHVNRQRLRVPPSLHDIPSITQFVVNSRNMQASPPFATKLLVCNKATTKNIALDYFFIFFRKRVYFFYDCSCSTKQLTQFFSSEAITIEFYFSSIRISSRIRLPC